jgi:diguanylate cyclase (GGDEF)-like protein
MTSVDRSFDLVSIEGTLVMEAREASHDEYVLEANGRHFSAIFRHPPGGDARALPPMRKLPQGSRVRVTGINMFYSTDPFNGPVASDLLLRNLDDFAVIAPPPVLSIRNLLLTVAALLMIVILVVARGWTLEHKVRREMAHFAALSNIQAEAERRRSRILEGINGNGPLPAILEEIVKLVSFRLKASPCWLESKDGACLVPRPSDLRGFHIERRELKSGSETHLGYIAAAFPPSVQLSPDHDKALEMGGWLATLAIETRRLYADLVQRSEFDQLTGAHNRFSLERHLNALIGSADSKSERFGLIYLDLDGFKQVNDVYGHHVGDLYLEQVAIRLQSRLRAHDVLARIGGDEFAAIISGVHTRADIEEVLDRLKSGFDQPVLIENNAFNVVASFGFALFPEDGATHDSLLAAADAVMYRAKNINKSRRGASLQR